MATAKWATPSAQSSNFAGSTLNSLANGSESTAVTYDNSTNRDLYAVCTVLLGSITPASGGTISVRVTLNDGTNTADQVGGDLYTIPLTTTTSAKVSIINMIRIYPFSCRISIINNSGVTLASSGNSIFLRPWNEDVT